MPWPSKYQEWIEHDGLLRLEAYARDDLTDVDIAKRIGISKSTLNEWKKKYPEIADSLKRGKEPVDIEVENSALKKCHGYNATVKKTFKLKDIWYDDQGRRCEKERLEVGYDEVHVPADTVAIIWWLCNRKPWAWRKSPADDGDTAALNQAKELLSTIKSVIE